MTLHFCGSTTLLILSDNNGVCNNFHQFCTKIAILQSTIGERIFPAVVPEKLLTGCSYVCMCLFVLITDSRIIFRLFRVIEQYIISCFFSSMFC